MKTKIIKIGNSQGIRLPKVILEQIGFEKEVEIEPKKDRIIIKPVRERRKNWPDSFKRMARNKDDHLLDGDAAISQSKWDEEEWTW